MAHPWLPIALALALVACRSPENRASAADPHRDGPLPGLVQTNPIPSDYTDALRRKADSYVPRTHHKHADGSPKFINRLILETSPYLLQHAHNPVNWYPWGDAAFERARAEEKLVLMSIGYSTCHWCHVMERESFEDIEIATYINTHFIAVKVDREERPDVDSVYMKAVNLLTGRGGWPMTTVLTPEREVIFGGTYFPPRDGDRGSRKGFLTILREVAADYTADPAGAAARAASLSERMARRAQPQGSSKVPGEQVMFAAAQSFAQSFDPVWGGFGGAPKFPRPSTFLFLGRYYRRTGDPQALAMLRLTLDKMAAGGMHDQIGGGFHRYSVDGQWLVPHFEKMLYDNAQLAVAYLEAFQITGDEHYAGLVRKTLDYVAREMTDPGGGFWSATDADSPSPNGHDEEGLFFTWTPDELGKVLGADLATTAGTYWGVTPGGNFEGRSILHQPEPLGAVAESLSKTSDDLRADIDGAAARLYQARQGRPPPILDDKVITAWNGLMITAFAKAGWVLGDPDYIRRAERAAVFVLANLDTSQGLRRTWKGGVAKHRAVLDDYAFLTAALLDLYEAGGNPRWLRRAKQLQQTTDAKFIDAQGGGYFMTASDAESLLVREKPTYDGAEPSGNSVALLNALRLAEFTGADTGRQTARAGLEALGGRLARGGRSLPFLLSTLDFFHDAPLQIVLIRPPGGGGSALDDVLRTTFVPNRVVSIGTEGKQLRDQSAEVPLLQGKVSRNGKTTAYVCIRSVCDLPTTDPNVFRRQLAVRQPLEFSPLAVREPAQQPKPWHYDPKTNKHWHPGHGHWHNGPPPKKH